MTDFYRKSIAETAKILKTDQKSGLTRAEAKKRLEEGGANVLRIQTTPLWRRLLEPFLDPFMIILFVAFILAIIQGSAPEAIMISIDIVVDAAIYYYQQFSTERILRSLQAETTMRVKVMRGGDIIEVDATDLVRGDIVYLSEGERIPADGRIIESFSALANESMLTGESASIDKNSAALSADRPLYERANMVYAGSYLISGNLRFIVTETGNSTEYGHIASLATESSIASPIQQKISRLVIWISGIIVILAGIILGIQLLNGFTFASAAEFTLALIVSAVPEDLPIATAIILAIGAKKLASRKALVRELRAIESIGVVSTVCTDKTGTLTENRLSVATTWTPRPINFGDRLIRTALPTDISADPMDTSLWSYAHAERLEDIPRPDFSYPFDQSIRMSGNLVKDTIYIKGAPETVLSHCDISDRAREIATLKITELSNFGYRVLAIAEVKPTSIPKSLNELNPDDHFKFIGLVAVADTIRRESRAAVYDLLHSGVAVKMITGDHAGTALTIGKKLGLAHSTDDVLDCTHLDQMDEAILRDRVAHCTVFARVSASDKYRILGLIRSSSGVVAMTGDGINDIPALRSADVGIAMGDSPSIVQDAANIVLVDNNFKTIADAIYHGRIVLSNIRRMLIYLLASNASEVMIGLFGLVFGHAQILLPIQILWVNLVTDNLMVIPLGLEPTEKTVKNLPPEDKNSPILSPLLVSRLVVTALSTTIVVCSVYFFCHYFIDEIYANTLAFTSLVVTQWSGALAIRGLYESTFSRIRVKNRLFIFAFVAAILLQLLANFGPFMDFTSTIHVPILPFIITIVISFIVPLLATELHKLSTRKSKYLKPHKKK